MHIKPGRIPTPLLSVVLLSVMALSADGQRGLPPREGITNFGKVNENLYRGAQPDAPGLKNLKRLGIRSVVNLCQTNEVWKTEETEVCANSLVYTNVPLAGLGRPTDEEVTKVLRLIETLPSPVFIHCRYGCDRTGTIIACYRIKHDKWSSADALQEARQYGLSRLERGMRRCIIDFAKQSVATDVSRR